MVAGMAVGTARGGADKIVLIPVVQAVSTNIRCLPFVEPARVSVPAGTRQPVTRTRPNPYPCGGSRVGAGTGTG